MENFMQYFTQMVQVLSDAGVELAEMGVWVAIAYGLWVIILEGMFYGFFLIIILKACKALDGIVLERRVINSIDLKKFKFERDVSLSEEGEKLLIDFAETLCTGKHLKNRYSLIGETKQEAIMRFAKKHGLELKESKK